MLDDLVRPLDDRPVLLLDAVVNASVRVGHRVPERVLAVRVDRRGVVVGVVRVRAVHVLLDVVRRCTVTKTLGSVPEGAIPAFELTTMQANCKLMATHRHSAVRATCAG